MPSHVLHLAGLSRPMDIHEKDIIKSIDLNIIGTCNLVKEASKKVLNLYTYLQVMFTQVKKVITLKKMLLNPGIITLGLSLVVKVQYKCTKIL